MKRFMTKKRLATAGIVAALVVAGGTAFAITTGNGSGSGSGTGSAGGAPNCTVSLSAVWDAPGTISPGGTATIDFYATNAGSAPCIVKSISANVVSGIGPVSSTNAACQSVIDEQQSQFWLTPVGSSSKTNVTVPQNGSSGVIIPADDTSTPLPNSGILSWLNSPSFDQSPCFNAPLSLSIVTP